MINEAEEESPREEEYEEYEEYLEDTSSPEIEEIVKSTKVHCSKCHYPLEVGETPCPTCGISTIYAKVNLMQPSLSPVRDYSKRKYYIAPHFAKPGEIGELFGYSNFDKGNPINADYALIDLETSGLSAKTSYIIEIAVIRMTREGKILSQFNTLINPPDGEVGKTDLHLISKADIVGAPTFAEVVGDILESLDNAIVVAHNAKFEESFLAAEFARTGMFDIPYIPSIDTMLLAQLQLDLPNYKLGTVLSHYKQSYENAHTALGDVLSMAKFLPALLDEVPEQLYPIEFARLPKYPMAKRLKERK